MALLVPQRKVMLYGASGDTKTTQTYHIAKWLLKNNPGKKIRYVSSDNGGYAPFLDSGMIERGQVEVFDYTNRNFPLADMRRLSEGYWPRYIVGEGKEAKAYPTQVEGSREFFKSTPVCMTTPAEYDNILAYIMEGMTSTGEVLKTHCSNQKEGVGFKESYIYEEDGYTILGLQMGHYGLVQKEIQSLHNKGFCSLPVPWLIWTALVGKGEDKQNRETVYGPQLVGNAATPNIPTWFMDCLHLSRESWKGNAAPKLYKEEEGKDHTNEVVAWFMKHNDVNTQIPYLAKVRCMPELVPKLMEYFPFGFVPIKYQTGIEVLFMVLNKLVKEMHDT